MNGRIRYERGGQPAPPPVPIPYQAGRLVAPPQVVSDLRVVGAAREVGPAATVQVLRALHSLCEPLILRIAISREVAEVGIRCAPWQAAEVQRAIHGVLPDWEVSASCFTVPSTANLCLSAAVERAECPDWAPLRDIGNLDGGEPLSALLEAVQPLSEHEATVIEYLIRPVDPARKEQALRDLTVPLPPGSLADVVHDVLWGPPRANRFEQRTQHKLEDRLSEPGFEIIGRTQVVGTDQARLAVRARSLTAAFATVFDGGLRGISLGNWQWRARMGAPSAAWPEGQASLYAAGEELATLWHFPVGLLCHPGMAHLRHPQTPLPLAVEKARGLRLGIYPYRGVDLPVHLTWVDLKAGPMAIVGATGTGKSTLNESLLAQAVAANNSLIVCVIDPNRNLVINMARRSIPLHREKHVALIDLDDKEFPIRLPFFRRPAGVSKEAFIETKYRVVRLLDPEQLSSSPRMNDLAFAITATLCQLPNGSLLHIPLLLGNAAFRRRAIAETDDEVAKQFWAEYEALSQPAQKAMARPLLYRFRALWRSRAVRNILGQTGDSGTSELFGPGKIPLISIAGLEIQGAAEFLGEMFISEAHCNLLPRLGQPSAHPAHCVLAVDESQRFRGASLPILLREGRKLGLTVMLSTQYLDAWGQDLARSILGNVGTLIAFRCGPDDARHLSAALRPFTAEQLQDLDRYQAVVKMQVNGATMPALPISSLSISEPPSEAALERIRANSRRLYARPRRDVEEELRTVMGQAPEKWQEEDVYEE